MLEATDAFYGEVMQNLKGWAAAPPRMRPEPDIATEISASLVSNALSSQDDPTITPVAATVRSLAVDDERDTPVEEAAAVAN